MRRWWVLAGSLVVLMGAIAVLLAPDRAPTGNASAVLGTFLHYTNDASGTRMGVFRISNQSQLPIRREYYYEVHVHSGSGWTNLPTVHLPSSAVVPVVQPGEHEVFVIKAPMTTSRWRLCYPYAEHESWIRGLRRELGLPSKHRRGFYAGFTDEVNP